MDWVCVFRGGGPTDAFLVRDWLVENGVRVLIRGDLATARGEIAIHETWPSVWVPAIDRPNAEAALVVYNAPRLVHPAWVCAGCGERNEATFGSCWQCGADGPALS
ncbi:MAG: hypothetical protein ABMB14_01175 [Myxococcota bacterium]